MCIERHGPAGRLDPSVDVLWFLILVSSGVVVVARTTATDPLDRTRPWSTHGPRVCLVVRAEMCHVVGGIFPR
jgi:hypothetical protein